MSGPEAAVNWPKETGGLRTIAAAVPGLAVATIWRRTPADGDWIDSDDAQMSLKRDESNDRGLSSVWEVAGSWEGVPHIDSSVKVCVGGDNSQRCGSLKPKDPSVDAGDCKACTPVTATCCAF